MPDKYVITMVVWQDCECLSGWHNQAAMDTFCDSELSVFKSLGWLVRNDDTGIVLAMSVGAYKAGELLRIPKAMILDVKTLTGDADG